MRYMVFNIEWDQSVQCKNPPEAVYVELDYDPFKAGDGPEIGDTHPVEDAVRAKLECDWVLVAWDIRRSPTIEQFLELFEKGIQHGRIECDNKTAARLMYSAHHALCNGVLDSLYNALERFTSTNTNDIVEIWAESVVSRHSYGLTWTEGVLKHEGLQYVAPLGGDNRRPFMRGGLIYRGPETNPNYKDRTWTIHT